MKRFVLLLLLIPFLLIRVHATELEIPQAPSGVYEYMPQENESFTQGLLYILTTAIGKLAPELAEGIRTGMLLLAATLASSVISSLSGTAKKVSELIAVMYSTIVLLNSTHSMIHLGIATITEIDGYGKLLLPVMAASLAASGGVSSSAALYGGTAIFSAVLTSVIQKAFIPLLYTFIAICVANRALGEDVLNSFKQFLKWLMTWTLKLILYLFTGFITITGVVSGSADAMSIKATKITISGMIPVVGGIISDASEAILVGAGVMKNAAGIYGVFAFLAICIGPVLKITIHCIVLRITAALCGILGLKAQTGIIEDFSQSMNLILAATGSVCLLLLISTVVFMKGVG